MRPSRARAEARPIPAAGTKVHEGRPSRIVLPRNEFSGGRAWEAWPLPPRFPASANALTAAPFSPAPRRGLRQSDERAGARLAIFPKGTRRKLRRCLTD